MVILLIHLVDREHSGHFLDGQRHLFCLATGDLLAMLHENILPTARNPRSLRKLMCVHTLPRLERTKASVLEAVVYLVVVVEYLYEIPVM